MSGSAGPADPAEPPELRHALEEARRLGFFGPRPATEQLAHARAFAALLDEARVLESPFLDIGSGGGLPGLALAAHRADLTGALLDASARRTTFLRETVQGLGWTDRIEVLEGRGEALAREPRLRGGFGLVVARSFGAPAVTAEIGGAFVRQGGVLAVSEPVDQPDGRDRGDRWPVQGLGRLGLEWVGRRSGSDARIAVIRRTRLLDDGWPRRVGVPGKRPLW
jgi:16S rRNA (guanine527-N7)-methyltransferase